MTREDQMFEMSGRLSAAEAKIEMLEARSEETETITDTLIRQMDHVFWQGKQALAQIGTLTRGLKQLETEVSTHTSRSLGQIIRHHWQENITTVMIIGGGLYLFPDFMWKLWLIASGAYPG